MNERDEKDEKTREAEEMPPAPGTDEAKSEENPTVRPAPETPREGAEDPGGRGTLFLTPEAPYRPPSAPRDVPLWVFGVLACVLLVVFFLLGRSYYRSNVLPDRLYQSASEHFEREEYEAAAREYEQADALQSKKSSDDVHYRRAYAYERVGKYEEAAAAYVRHLAEHSGDMRAVASLGKIYYSLGRSEDALPYLERTAEAVSGDAALSLALGRLYEWRSDDVRAADAYADFVALETSDAETLLEVGRFLMKSARYKDALSGFERANGLLASDDKRGYHAVNAAKNMLGWPTDEGMVVTPGASVGNMHLGLTRPEALEAWGKPLHQVDEEGYSVWGYNGTADAPETVVFFDDDGVIEIVTESKKHATSDGLSLANFREVKYADRFLRTRDENADPHLYRYILKGGGLAFYTGDAVSSDKPRAVVYDGTRPLTEHLDAEWRYYWD
ncbi:tetratricopeptide repeat protein [Synergistaceae bacterium OttesenSCG-928-I11]|nr:tetratricopeptide repeat protein [Synergistaceae bacterium OttesenSCG-928-I11]